LLLIAGLGGRYSSDTHQNIPALWQRFQPYLGNVPGQVFAGGGGKGGRTFGVCYNMDDDCNFDYLAGVEVSGFSDLPAEFARLRIPSQRYALFTHHEHVSTMHGVAMTIWTKWLPESGYEAVDAPYLEYYGEEFDGRTGLGGYQYGYRSRPNFALSRSALPSKRVELRQAGRAPSREKTSINDPNACGSGRVGALIRKRICSQRHPPSQGSLQSSDIRQVPPRFSRLRRRRIPSDGAQSLLRFANGSSRAH
jgi:predicted transcriptional regulator YdeE